MASYTTSEEKRDTLADRAPIKSPSTTDLVECEHTNKCGEHVCDGVDTCDPLDLAVGDSSETEDFWRVESDTGDTCMYC